VSRPHDKAFAKYSTLGAYHWGQISRNLRQHHAFTAERYRRALAALDLLPGMRVLDYGCGDGALLVWISRCIGPTGELHGYDPNPEARSLARTMLAANGIDVTIHADPANLASAYFDRVVCADVIEHVHDPHAVLLNLYRALKPGGRAVVTTPIRLTETPLDPNHVHEWFPSEFRALLDGGPFELLRHEEAVPVSAADIYQWRPRAFLRLPVLRLLCNLASAYFGVNALTWLGLPSRRFMLQVGVLEKR
jgi:2-polyprenyl-3-methyl-5-hydroxy-6-metoxy-1,4-benzoquinol methylase